MKARLAGWRWTAILGGACGLVTANSCQVDGDYTYDEGKAGNINNGGGAGRDGSAGSAGKAANAGSAGSADSPGNDAGRGGAEGGSAGAKTTGSGGTAPETGGAGPQSEGGSDPIGGEGGELNQGGTVTVGGMSNGGAGMAGTSSVNGGTLNQGGGGVTAGKGGTSDGGSGGTAGKSASGGTATGGTATGGTVNLNTNPDNCGALGRVCSSANVNVRVCAGGVCSSTCKAGAWNVRLPAAPLEDDGCEAECPATAGSSAMLRLPQGYCIDKTEVSRGQYQAWLDTAPSTSGQPADCNWNASFVPGATCIAAAYQGTGFANHPMVCVDWCDAQAYCRAMGKRLCGRIGGGANAYADLRDATRSQWFNACVSGPTNNAYPYGTNYGANACNGADYQNGLGTGTRTIAVGSRNSCQSSVAGYAGAFDLSGNVWEWEDSCQSASLSALCRARGGAYFNSETLLRCDDSGDSELRRDDALSSVGFRCCAN